jgi:hypothetical protein
MQREKGDSRFQKDRFDYDYTNIYRSTQDLDIVIDGNPEQANKLQQALQEKYPHLQGNKTAWEVRLLTQDMSDKQAILNNPDFMNQHTDSNSTGMIEITKPKNGEHVVRDVRDWNAKDPYFLKDIHDGMLHYYFSPLHETTKFAKGGRNPPILSAIRFLTKAFQYELKIRPEDLASIRKIIQEFDPKRDTQNSYVSNWIEKNGKKLIQNAVNIEYAKNTLDQLGLREKLQSTKGDIGTTDSLAWWMNKEPLRTQLIGQGTGKTAKELGLDIVAHETNHFLAYESITRAHTGDPNVLISRSDAAGETAAHGNGFYTKTGKEGARGTGLTIRFHLNPDAREGHDFNYDPSSGYVVIKNKAALKVIPESLNIGPIEYFRMLAEGGNLGLQSSDRGILEKLKRRMSAKIQGASPIEIREISDILKSKIQTLERPQGSEIIQEWFSLPLSAKHPEIVDQLLEKTDAELWIAEKVLSRPHGKNFTGLAERIIKNGKSSQAVSKALARPYWKDRPDLVELLLKDPSAHAEIATHILTSPHWQNYPEWAHWVEQLIEKGSVDRELITEFLVHPFSFKHPEWVEKILKRGHQDRLIAHFLLPRPEWKDHPEWVELLLKRGTADRELATAALPQAHWMDHPELIDRLIENGKTNKELINNVFFKPHWRKHPKFTQWINLILERKNADTSIVETVLSQQETLQQHPEWMETILKRGTADKEIATFILSQPFSQNHPEWMEAILQRGNVDSEIAQSALPKPHWKDHPEWVEKIIRHGKADHYLEVYTFPYLHWSNHPELRRLAGGKHPTVKILRAAFERGETVQISPKACLLQHLNGKLN